MPASKLEEAHFHESEGFHVNNSNIVPRTGQIWLAEVLAMFDQVSISGKFDFQQARIPSSHNLNMASWREELQGLRNILFVRVPGVWLASKLPANCTSIFSRQKHFSALSFIHQLQDFVQEEVISEAILGPFKVSPFHFCKSTPLCPGLSEILRRGSL